MTGLIHEPLLVPTAQDEVLETLQRTRRLIERGWTQGRMKRHHLLKPPSYCLLGALEEVTGHDVRVYTGSYTAIYIAAGMEPTYYNDCVAFSKNDVLEVLDRAIDTRLAAR